MFLFTIVYYELIIYSEVFEMLLYADLIMLPAVS